MDLLSSTSPMQSPAAVNLQEEILPSALDPLAQALIQIAESTTSTPRRTAPQLLDINFSALHTALVSAAAASSLGKISRWVSHDLAQIFTMLNLLTDDFGDQIRTACREHHAQCAELRRLVSMLHHVATKLLAAVRDGTLETRRPVSMRSVVDAAIKHVKYAAQRAAIEIRHHRTDQLVTISPFAVEQVLSNLLANAVDAVSGTGRGDGCIEVAYRLHGGRLLVSVTDNGPGVTPDATDKIFRCGYSTKAEGAHGFGLVICSHFVMAEGGTLEVSTPPNGIGATFTFDLSPADPRHPGQISSSASCD